MPKQKIDLGYAVKLAPKDAIAYFESKGYKISFDWWEIEARAHAQSFTVAHAARLDILKDIREAFDKALKQGITERDFVKQLTPLMQTKGWWGKQVLVDAQGGAKVVQLGSPWRLKNIYRTNKRVAFAAGRYKQQKEDADISPWWQYVAMLDSRTRPGHRALDGRVFRHDDPVWDSIYPPNGWGCRCRVRTLSDRRLKRLGLKPESSEGRLRTVQQELGVDKFTGEVITRPATALRYTDPVSGETKWFTPSPGWSHNPGKLAYGTDIELLRKLSRVKDSGLRAQVIQRINNNPARHKAFSAWVDARLRQRRPGHDAAVIGLITDTLAEWVHTNKKTGIARIVALPHKRLIHADSPKHAEDGIALSLEEYKRLPEILANPDAVYWDKKHRNLVFVQYAEDGGLYYLPVSTEQALKRHGRMDVLVNAYKLRPGEGAGRLLDTNRYERVE